LNAWAGGRVFPGIHHRAGFNVNESDGNFIVAFKADDGTYLSINARETGEWNEESLFDSLDSAADFFKRGSVGYSPDKIGEAFEGLELKTLRWEVFPLKVKEVRSSFFENKSIFPEGSIRFDNALLMKSIEHEWKTLNSIRNNA